MTENVRLLSFQGEDEGYKFRQDLRQHFSSELDLVQTPDPETPGHMTQGIPSWYQEEDKDNQNPGRWALIKA